MRLHSALNGTSTEVEMRSRDGDTGFNFFSDGFDRALLPQESICQRFVLAHQAEQQMLRLDVRTPILAGFVPGKKMTRRAFSVYLSNTD